MAFKIKDGVSIGTVPVFDNSGDLLVNAPTATKWLNARSISLTGDVTGTVNSVDGTANISITTTIQPDSVTLGTDTTGDYVATITAGNAITISGSGSENAQVTVSHSDTSALAGQYGGSGIAGITVDDNGHVTAITTATYLSSFTESDTLATVTGRTEGNTTGTPIILTNTTPSTTSSTGALIVSGGVGIGGAIVVAGNATIAGNLTVSGTTTTVNSTTTTLTDPILTLGGSAAPTSDDNKDRGIEFKYHNGTVAKLGFFGFDDSSGTFTFIPDATNDAEVFSGTVGTINAKIDYGNILNTPAINAGKLDLAIGAAGSTNTSVTVGSGDASTGFNANSATDFTYKVRVGPSLGNLASLMTGSATGIIRKSGQDTYELDTTSYLSQAVTTFSTGTTGLTATGSGVTTPTNAAVFGNVVLSGVLDLDNGGTGSSTAAGARINLGASIVGGNLFTVTDPSEVRYIRINEDNTVSLLTQTEFKTAIGADFTLTIDTINGITGGPVNGSGTYTFELTGTTRAIHNLTTNGFLVKTGADTVATRSITAGTGITVTNGTGVSGDVVISAISVPEADTLNSVTTRGNTTLNGIQVDSTAYGIGGTEAAEIKALTATVASVGATTIDTWSITDYRSAKYIIQITQGINYEIGEVLVTHNGNNAKLTHYGVIETNTALTAATAFTAVISGTDLQLKLSMQSVTTATVRMVRTLIK